MIKYITPWWANGKVNYGQVTDGDIAGWREDTKQANRRNQEGYERVRQKHEEILKQAIDLYGTDSAPVKALRKVSIPRPPSFDKEWSKLIRSVNNARHQIAEAMEAHVRRVRATKRRKERRLEAIRLEAEREAYVADLPCSD